MGRLQMRGGVRRPAELRCDWVYPQPASHWGGPQPSHWVGLHPALEMDQPDAWMEAQSLY